MKHCCGIGVMVVFLAGATSVSASDPNPRGTGKGTSKTEADTLSVLLQETVEMKDFQEPLSFKQFLGRLHEKLAPKGKELPISVDVNAFKEENPEGPSVWDMQIQFSPFPRKQKLAVVLRRALQQLAPHSATFVLREGVIEITTFDRSRPQSLVRSLLAGEAMPASASITIDPKTSLADLLPLAPKTINRMPWFTTDLTKVPEVSFQEPLSRQLASDKAVVITAQQLAKIQHANRTATDFFLKTLIQKRADLQGLPYAMGADCRSVGEPGKLVALLSRLVRRSISEAVEEPELQSLPLHADVFWSAVQRNCQEIEGELVKLTGFSQVAYDGASVAALMQVLAAESAPVRRGLVKHLSRIPHVEATRALAKLALFSAEDEVRLPALEALKLRRERDYTALLIQGFRYPLPAVARHAAEAAVRLERADLVPQLVDLLEKGDPRLPAVQAVGNKKLPVVRELVRINHHRNCMLCHAPFTSEKNPDGFRLVAAAPVPLPSEPLPSRSAGYQGDFPSNNFVDISVTYLRPDFSLMQPVHEAAPWPDVQRFDFLVRTRILSDEEAAEYKQKATGVEMPYQRAILFALRELTGRDTAPTPRAWRDLLGLPAKTDVSRLGRGGF